MIPLQNFRKRLQFPSPISEVSDKTIFHWLTKFLSKSINGTDLPQLLYLNKLVRYGIFLARGKNHESDLSALRRVNRR